jgi:hypothetical protein
MRSRPPQTGRRRSVNVNPATLSNNNSVLGLMTRSNNRDKT